MENETQDEEAPKFVESQSSSRPGSNILSSNEIRKIYETVVSARSRKVPLTQIGRALQLLSQAPTQAALQAICDSYTPENLRDGEIAAVAYDDFARILRENVMDREERLAELTNAFLFFDKEEAGVIDAEELKAALLTVGDCLTNKEAAEFFKEAKPQADGKLPYDGKST
ncbi:Troponin C skeletal muscle [Fasciola gigantica]|uniref:Troponin C skeletal muscle n=1 Tax=Fasciola gigantica TaxID=46835 RepID=A0A504YJT8_FASGI|nr:Troponin C skeletal muscle [Fasciola gigantica]